MNWEFPRELRHGRGGEYNLERILLASRQNI